VEAEVEVETEVDAAAVTEELFLKRTECKFFEKLRK
jgi:hypothetical protein